MIGRKSCGVLRVPVRSRSSISALLFCLPPNLIAADRTEGRMFATRSVVHARHGMVAAAHPLAVQIGIDVLKALYHNAQQVKWQREQRQDWFVLFSRAGFQPALVDRASHPNSDGRYDVLLVHDGEVVAGNTA